MSSEMVEEVQAETVRLLDKRILLERIIVTEIGGIKLPDEMIGAKKPNNVPDWFTVVNVAADCDQKEIKVGSKVFAEGYQRFNEQNRRVFYLVKEPGLLAIES